ncbi:MAG: hypothetical protein ACU88J_09740 [Gammaproteobacteria bacterium]
MRTPRPENDNLKLLECFILGISPEQVFDDIVSLAAQICGTPFALITAAGNGRE